MLNAALKKLAHDLQISTAQMEKEWRTALDIATARVGKDSPTRFAYATRVLKNRLKLVAHSGSFEAFCAANPEWFEEYTYNQQKEYLEQHPDSEFKISKKKPHKSGRQDTKTPEQKRRERLYNKTGSNIKKDEKESGGKIAVVEKHNPEADEKDARQKRLDAASQLRADESAGKKTNLPAVQSEFSERSTRNMVNVGHRALAEDLNTIADRVMSDKTSDAEIDTFKKLNDQHQDEEDDHFRTDSKEFKTAANLCSKVAKGVLLSVAAIALFTPLAPFGMVIGMEYAKHRLGFKDNMFDEIKDNADDFFEKLSENKRKANALVAKRNKDKEKERKASQKRLEEMAEQATKGEEKELNAAPTKEGSEKKKPSKVIDVDYSESNVFSAFAGDNQDLVKEMAKDIYDKLCAVDIKKLHKACKLIGGANNADSKTS